LEEGEKGDQEPCAEQQPQKRHNQQVRNKKQGGKLVEIEEAYGQYPKLCCEANRQ